MNSSALITLVTIVFSMFKITSELDICQETDPWAFKAPKLIAGLECFLPEFYVCKLIFRIKN